MTVVRQGSLRPSGVQRVADPADAPAQPIAAPGQGAWVQHRGGSRMAAAFLIALFIFCKGLEKRHFIRKHFIAEIQHLVPELTIVVRLSHCLS
jgi:hypothetical protein